MTDGHSATLPRQQDDDGYAVPRSTLTDAANDVGRHLSPDNTDWLADLMAGYLHQAARAEVPENTLGYCLALLTVFDRIEKACASYIIDCVAAARKEGATWSAIGERLGISKSTAFSRWGSVIETHGENTFFVDHLRDRNIPLVRIDDPRAQRATDEPPITPTEEQRRTIVDRFTGTEAAEPENIDLVVNAFLILARSLARATGADWNDPAEAEHYLELALAVGRR